MENFTHPNKFNPLELTDAKTTPDENHKDNGATPPLITQTSFPHSPLIDALVATDEHPPHPCIEDSDAVCLAIMVEHPKFCIKGANDTLSGV